MAVKFHIMVFSAMAPRRMVGRYQRFRENTASIFRAETEEVYSSEMLVSTNQTTRCHSTGDRIVNLHLRETSNIN
jgi:hypothetical protein